MLADKLKETAEREPLMMIKRLEMYQMSNKLVLTPKMIV